MAVPFSLKKIETEKALQIINKHLKAGTGYWEYGPNVGDFVYEGRKTKWGRRQEMLRPNGFFGGKMTYEHAVVSN